MLKTIWITEDLIGKWDDFVYNHPYGNIGNLSLWKNIIEESFSHIKGHILALINENNEIIAGLPVYTVNSWLRGKRLVCTPFSTLFDPLISNAEQFEVLFNELVTLYKKEKSKTIEIRSYLSTSIIASQGLQSSCYYKHLYLLLEGDLDDLKKTFHRTCIRKPISIAVKNRLNCRETKSFDDLKSFYHLFFITRKRLGLPVIPFLFFKSIWKHLSESKNVIILIAEKEEKPIGAMLLFQFKERLLADYLGWDKEYKKMNPSVFLYWEAIKYAHQTGLKIFDFGRTFSLNNSLMSFKKRWNPEIDDFVEFYYPVDDGTKSLPKELSKKYNLIVRTLKVVPSPIYRSISNFLYKHLG